jgi:hypothetical protein
MTKWPMGAREDIITEYGGRSRAEQLSNPDSVSVLSVPSTYGDKRFPISAGVIHATSPPQYAETAVFGVAPLTTAQTSSIRASFQPLITTAP